MRLGRLQTFALAVVLGTLVTAGMLWLFDIQLADREMLKTFPDGWHIMDLVRNVLALLMFGGSIRVIDKAMWQEMRRDTATPEEPPS